MTPKPDSLSTYRSDLDILDVLTNAIMLPPARATFSGQPGGRTRREFSCTHVFEWLLYPGDQAYSALRRFIKLRCGLRSAVEGFPQNTTRLFHRQGHLEEPANALFRWLNGSNTRQECA